MRVLFFFVHPSKYHLFRHTIGTLRSQGHEVEIALITKDVLEELVRREGWDYTNIYPEGRRGRLPTWLMMPLFAARTLWRLRKLVAGRRFDLFVTDDLLAVLGWWTKTPVLMMMDDDLAVVPETGLLYSMATTILAPNVTNLGRFSDRKVGYEGCHELAYLRPPYFTPDPSVIDEFNPGREPYCILRLVSLTATHDRGQRGISDTQVSELIALAERRGKVFISAERQLPEKFERYRIRIAPEKIAHALYFADLFIGDSQTMTTEAAVLGTPALRYSNFVGRISSIDHLEKKYGLTFGFRTNQFDSLRAKAAELLAMPDLKREWARRRERFLNDTVDVNSLILREISRFDPTYADVSSGSPARACAPRD